MDDLSVMIMIVINPPPPHNTFTLCFLQTHFGLLSRWWLLALCQSLLHLMAGFDTLSTINYPKVWICFWHILLISLHIQSLLRSIQDIRCPVVLKIVLDQVTYHLLFKIWDWVCLSTTLYAFKSSMSNKIICPPSFSFFPPFSFFPLLSLLNTVWTFISDYCVFI